MVHAADAEHAVSAGMREAGLQVRQPVEDAAEDQRGERRRRLQRIPDDVRQVVARQPGIGAAARRVEIEHRAELLGRLQDGKQFGAVPVLAVHVGADHDARHARGRGRSVPARRPTPAGILQGQIAEPDEAIRTCPPPSPPDRRWRRGPARSRRRWSRPYQYIVGLMETMCMSTRRSSIDRVRASAVSIGVGQGISCEMPPTEEVILPRALRPNWMPCQRSPAMAGASALGGMKCVWVSIAGDRSVPGRVAPAALRSTFRVSSVFSSRRQLVAKSKHMSGQSASAAAIAVRATSIRRKQSKRRAFPASFARAASALLIGLIRTNNDLSGPASSISVGPIPAAIPWAKALALRGRAETAKGSTWRGST